MSLRERNRIEQRQRILDAAFALFAERGFDEVTVAEVAVAAGVARATVFNYFPSKHGLVEAITVQVLVFYQQMLDKALAAEQTPTPLLLRALYEQMGAGIEGFRRFQRGVFREIARLQLGFDEGGAAQCVNEENQARLSKLFARGQERGEIEPAHPPESLAAIFSILANGTITAWLFEDVASPREDPSSDDEFSREGGAEASSDDEASAPHESLRERMANTAEVLLAPVAIGPRPPISTPVPDLSPAPFGSS